MHILKDENVNYVDLAMRSIRAARHAAKLAREKEGPPKTLKEQIKDEIIEWYENLHPSEKQVAWHMDFLTKRFGAPALIGPALRENGFIDKRDWSRRPYRRYWYGPETKEAKENL